MGTGKTPQNIPQVALGRSERRSIIEDIHLSDLNFDRWEEQPGGYQRGKKASLAWAKDILKNKGYDPDAVGQLLVNIRSDGTVYCVQGQGRYHLLFELLGITVARAEIFEGLSRKEEAKLHLRTQVGTRVESALDKFYGALGAEDPFVLKVNERVRAFGFKVGPRALPVSAVLNVAALSDDVHILDKSLAIIKTAWCRGLPGVQTSAMRSVLIEGLGLFLKRFETNPGFNEAAFIKKLGTVHPDIFQQINRGGGQPRDAYQARDNFMAFYDKGRTEQHRLAPRD